MGRPLVSFDLREARVSAGDAALYVTGNDVEAFGQGIVTLLDDPERREKMGSSDASVSNVSCRGRIRPGHWSRSTRGSCRSGEEEMDDRRDRRVGDRGMAVAGLPVYVFPLGRRSASRRRDHRARRGWW